MKISKDAEKTAKQAVFLAYSAEFKRAEMISMFLNTVGGGLVLFGWISTLLGRRGAFIFYHTGGFLMALLMFMVLIPHNAPVPVLYIALPVFGFLTLGMHAGYAVYFPELFPTRLRGTGTGFCFNAGRIGTAAAMLLAAERGWATEDTALYMAPLYALRVGVTLAAKETCNEDLPE